MKFVVVFPLFYFFFLFLFLVLLFFLFFSSLSASKLLVLFFSFFRLLVLQQLSLCVQHLYCLNCCLTAAATTTTRPLFANWWPLIRSLSANGGCGDGGALLTAAVREQNFVE